MARGRRRRRRRRGSGLKYALICLICVCILCLIPAGYYVIKSFVEDAGKVAITENTVSDEPVILRDEQPKAEETEQETVVETIEETTEEATQEVIEWPDFEVLEPVVSVTTEFDPIGATVWPVQDLPVYDNMAVVVDTVAAGTPMMVLSYEYDLFKVSYDGKMGLVAADACMINLPDVMQQEMRYDITNSYSSIYRIHGDDIDNVTGEVLYPYVKQGTDNYLVPLLVPVAKALFEAEAGALEMGYTIKIYDAYRPHSVTNEIYDKTSAFVKKYPEYLDYMTEEVGGTVYKQSNFLAKSVSNHNYGVAIDITLVNCHTGEEMQMQSEMHELSTLSVLDRNNPVADALQELMTAYGFEGLKSEWWHFQIKACRMSVATFQARPYEEPIVNTIGADAGAEETSKTVNNEVEQLLI
ncbi:MAG: hypothetical protein E7290_11195 [Lachnospiraceae bacterium]|nr:hypothetical protein [Lachnospiraceae bacterium]